MDEYPPMVSKAARLKRIAWPMFGFDRARTRNLQVTGVRPPFKTIWKYEAGVLLEFPPVYARGRLYLIDNDAQLKSLDPDTGKVLWERRIGRLNASSPTFHRGFLYVVNLDPGQVMKIRASTGKTAHQPARRNLRASTGAADVVVAAPLRVVQTRPATF